MSVQTASVSAKINDRRKALESLADSDLPCAELAEALLEEAESEN